MLRSAARSSRALLASQLPSSQTAAQRLTRLPRGARSGARKPDAEELHELPAPAPGVTPGPGLAMATFAGGCFWSVELAYQREPGVTRTSVGYCQGTTANPTYEQTCSGRTGARVRTRVAPTCIAPHARAADPRAWRLSAPRHARALLSYARRARLPRCAGHTEAVLVEYDPKLVSYERLCEVLWSKIDATQADGQGGDRGTQYRTGIYYHDDAQKAAAIASRAAEQARLGRTIQTEVFPAKQWWDAEKYHQQYLAKGGRFGRAQSTEKGCNDPIRCYG